MRTIAIPMVVGGLIAGSIFFAGYASAYCDAAECVPNVAHNIIAGGPCAPRKTFDFGLDRAGNAFVCNTTAVWAPVGPLVGVHNVALGCPGLNLSAQGSDGVPFQCVDMGGGALKWAHRPDTPG